MTNMATGVDPPVGGEGSGLEEGAGHPQVHYPVTGDVGARDAGDDGGGWSDNSDQSPPKNLEAGNGVPEGGAGGGDPEGAGGGDAGAGNLGEAGGDDADSVRGDGEYRRVSPHEILASPYGEDVNPIASPAEELALEQSIAEVGINNPIICEETSGGTASVSGWNAAA